MQLPFTWSSPAHSCVVGIDIPAAVGGSEKTSLYDIRMAAQAVAVECVIKPPHLGGIVHVGWKTKLQVVLVASDSRPPGLQLGKVRGLNQTVGELDSE